jgi:hypothetical protein
MIYTLYTLKEYCSQFKVRNKNVCAKTIENMAKKGLLPSGHEVIKLPGRTGPRVIAVLEEAK